VLGATAALVERFSVRRFWAQVRRYRATVFDFLGATLTLLHKQSPAPDDVDNPARLGWGVPLPAWAGEFERRFGVELVEVYGLSDAGIVLYNRPGEPRRPGSCGRPVEPFDVRVLDEDGFELPGGQVGEICVRPREPHVIMTGYLGMPDATAEAWRDLWFHTGDLALRDADGYFYFAGRTKDVIRRRGENIPALEIEDAVRRHSAVLDVAAFGVPSELTEEDVMVAVAVRPGHELNAPELLAHCAELLPRHMVPRYVELTDTLPRTPTEKVEKHVLRARGVRESTFDSERNP
jgi:carnitine-CoA ligase